MVFILATLYDIRLSILESIKDMKQQIIFNAFIKAGADMLKPNFIDRPLGHIEGLRGVWHGGQTGRPMNMGLYRHLYP